MKLSVSGEKGEAVSAGKRVKLSAQGNLLGNLDVGKNRRKLPTFLYRRTMYSTECSSAIHVLREAQYDAEVVGVAMVLGSVLGAGNMLFLPVGKFYWIAGFNNSTTAVT